LVLDAKELVVLIDAMSMMDVVKNHVELAVEDYLLVVIDQDDDQYEHILLVQQLLVENLNHYNLLVVFFDNNLKKTNCSFLINIFLSKRTCTIDIIAFFIKCRSS
jgi:hypothetical protein